MSKDELLVRHDELEARVNFWVGCLCEIDGSTSVRLERYLLKMWELMRVRGALIAHEHCEEELAAKTLRKSVLMVEWFQARLDEACKELEGGMKMVEAVPVPGGWDTVRTGVALRR